MTPAMAARVTDTLRDTKWIVGVIDARAPKPQKPGPKGPWKLRVDSVGDNVAMPPPDPQIVKGHCPNCGSRKAYGRCEHVVELSGEDDGTSASDTGMILECCGCERIYFRRDFWISEWDTNETVYWPAPVRRQRPNWFQKIQESERDLGMLLEEMYAALDNDLRVLAAIAVRTVFDRASELLEVDPALPFEKKLERLRDDGTIGVDEEKSLRVLVDAGSAAAHRGWRPKADELSTMVDLVEAFLHRSFVLGDGIEKLKASVPARLARQGT